MRRKPFDQINVIPFIDIMLVLLVIVLTTATFIAKGAIPLDLPKASSASNLPVKRVEISITKDNRLFFDKTPISVEELAKRLANISKKSEIIIRSDKSARFELFVKVLDRLKQQNFQNIAIETQK